jgi:outer membrane protein assembly factor BamE (lipoprotein component of BamABCDE complex)
MNVSRFPLAMKSTLAALLAAGALLLPSCAGVPPIMNDERFGIVQTGMTKDEVLELYGRPQETMKYPNRTESWDYVGRDTWGYQVDYAVVFGEDGQVVSKIARRLNDGGDKNGK